MEITRMDRVGIVLGNEESEAVKIAATNLFTDIRDVLGCLVEFDNATSEKRIVIKTEKRAAAKKESYRLQVNNGEIEITGSDRRGTIYGIYTLSEMLGVSPWYFFADVPKKRKEKFVLPDGFVLEDDPEIEYRGIFINDEEELEHWVQTYMEEETIGVKTYEKVFELLLRLKLNYIWPAMHVNSFNINRENGALADKMGIVVGTSHCDMLMRSNNREWVPWLEKKGYKAEYDFSIPGKNRDILTEYWRESVQQNKDFEVSYTLGMRGIHDSGFNVERLKGLEGQELIKAKIQLLEDVIDVQQKIISEELGRESLKIFVPYKEVLELYDNGLKVPEDLTLIWVNDNYGYVRRYPNQEERTRKGGNGLYYHNSYWAPPGNSYMFICSIPLAHTKNELKKAYGEGIQKLWVTNFGTIKPHEMQMSFFADYAWEAGKEKKTKDVDEWLKNWLLKSFSGIDAECVAAALNDFDQLTNVRKIEHLEGDVFSLSAYGDEGAYRLHRYEQIFETVNNAYSQLPECEKDAFFQMVVMKVQAAYYSNAMFYYGDRSRLCLAQGKNPAAQKYTILSLKFDRLRREMLYYYNHIMSDGKWNNILTPEDFPPPRTAMYPACTPPLFREKKGLVVTTWGGNGSLNFANKESKWIEIANSGEGEISYEISAPEWVRLSKCRGSVQYEDRISVRVETDCDCNGFIKVTSLETGEIYQVVVAAKMSDNGFDDGRLIVEAESFSSKTDDVEIIKRLGRDRGNLLQLNKSGAEVTYKIEVPETGEYLFVIHRFPSLNSVGRIRCNVVVDSRNPFVYESETRDEHQGTWKHNVQNNVDDTVCAKVQLDSGVHTIKIVGVDAYFSYSRFVLYYGEKKKDNLAVHLYGNALPKEFDTEAFSRAAYGDVKLEPRKVAFGTELVVHNANTDYDEYRPGEAEIEFDEWPEKSYEAISTILESGEKIFAENNGKVSIFAASALIESEFATITGINKELVSYCNSPAFGGTGIAIYLPESGAELKPQEAPTLKYAFETEEACEKTLWMRLFMWGSERGRFEVTIDGVTYRKEDFLIPGVWTYSAENMWRYVPVLRIMIPAGRHEMEIKMLSRGLRIERIVIGDKEIDKWNN